MKVGKIRSLLPFFAAGLVLFFISIDIFFGNLGFFEYISVKHKYTEMVNKRDGLRGEISEMEKEVDRLKNDMNYIEEIARSNLGFVKKREKIIIIDE